MPIKSDERMIRGVRLITNTIPALEGTVIKWRLMNLLSPAMVTLRSMSGPDKVKLLTAVSRLEELTIESFGDLVGVLGEPFSAIFRGVNPRELPSMFRDLFLRTIAVRDGVKYELWRSEDQINEAFDGDDLAMWMAAIWVARHNFATFGLGRLVDAAKASATAAESTSPTSTKNP